MLGISSTVGEFQLLQGLQHAHQGSVDGTGLFLGSNGLVIRVLSLQRVPRAPCMFSDCGTQPMVGNSCLSHVIERQQQRCHGAVQDAAAACCPCTHCVGLGEWSFPWI
jgi:hypothetical protein